MKLPRFLYSCVSGVVLFTAFACDDASDPVATGDGGGIDAGVDGMVTDGGPSEEGPLTLSPEACQADIELLRAEDFEVRDHPWAYKSDFHGFREVDTADGPRYARVSLTTDTVLAVEGQAVPGFSEDFALELSGSANFAIAPDHGSENDPDYPIAFPAVAKQSGTFGETVSLVVRSDGAGGLVVSYSDRQPLSLGEASGKISELDELSMGPHGDLVAIVELEENEGRYVVHEATAGSGFRLLLAQGTPMDSGDADTPRFVGGIISAVASGAGSAIVKTEIVDQSDVVEGTAWLAVDFLTRDIQCLATDSSILCGGLLISEGFRVNFNEFSSDGATTAAVLRKPNGEGALHYKVIGNPTSEEISVNGQFENWSFSNIADPKVCSRNNSVYFMGRLNLDYELFRIDESGSVEQLTDFSSLQRVAELKGQIPREIKDWELGYNCDAVLYMWGPSTNDSDQGYEGYWAVYNGGDTVEVLDDTPGRMGENGELPHVPRARSGLDPNALTSELVRIGPEGELYFVARIPEGEALISTYAVATEPVNRCRAPNRVNSDGDGPDQAPGDGRCDTGSTIGEDPECTLRAALEETNAAPGSDVIEFEGPRAISLQDGLPAITSRLTVVGPATVDGSALEGINAGLIVEVDDVEIRGLTLRGFPGHGIEARRSVRLDSVTLEDNCGWGIYAKAPFSLSGQDAVSSIERNGVGDNCEAGGIFVVGEEAQQGTVRISDAIISDNAGPGIASVGLLELGSATIENNHGDGIVAQNLGGDVGIRVRHTFGDLRVSGNDGHGISVEGGGFSSIYGNTIFDGNCGWGIETLLAPIHLGQADGSGGMHSISNNGITREGGGRFFSISTEEKISMRSERCHVSGGLSATGLSAEGGEPTTVTRATIEKNRGPGIASTGRIRLWSTNIKGNSGPGILQAEETDEGTARETTTVEIDGLSNSITFNLGSGVRIESGSIDIRGTTSIADNHGAGIEVQTGNMALGSVSGSDVTTIERNASADLQCKSWSITAESTWETSDLADCEQQAGAITLAGNITSYRAVVRRNDGPGFSAADPDDEDLGVLNASFGEVCENGAPNEARTSNLTDVATTCSD